MAPRRKSDDLLLAALAGGATAKEAAAVGNVSLSTVKRRLADPEFRAKVDATRAELTSEALGRLTSAMTAAADVLAKLLSSHEERIQLQAARSILGLAARVREATELDGKISELESLLRGLQSDGGK